MSNLVRIPNSEVWINPAHIVAVARMPDTKQPVTVHPGEPEPAPIYLINIQIRSADGKSTSVQHSDRREISLFLQSIGAVWEG